MLFQGFSSFSHPFHASKLIISENWAAYVNGVEERGWNLVVVSTLLSLIAYWVASALFLYVDVYHAPKCVAETKVQKKRDLAPSGSPYMPSLLKAVLLVLANQMLVVVPSLYFVDKFTTSIGLGLIKSAELPTMTHFVLHAAAGVAAVEICFYSSHRLLHTPWLYKNVHKVHHEYKATIGLAALYAHPVEALIGNTLAVIAPPFFFCSHALFFLVGAVVGWITTVNGHSGYSRFAKDGFHDFHHSDNVGNFGSLRVMDSLMGTDKKYLQFVERQSKKRATGGTTDRVELDSKSFSGLIRIVKILLFFSVLGVIDHSFK